MLWHIKASVGVCTGQARWYSDTFLKKVIHYYGVLTTNYPLMIIILKVFFHGHDNVFLMGFVVLPGRHEVCFGKVTPVFVT